MNKDHSLSLDHHQHHIYYKVVAVQNPAIVSLLSNRTALAALAGLGLVAIWAESGHSHQGIASPQADTQLGHSSTEIQTKQLFDAFGVIFLASLRSSRSSIFAALLHLMRGAAAINPPSPPSVAGIAESQLMHREGTKKGLGKVFALFKRIRSEKSSAQARA